MSKQKQQIEFDALYAGLISQIGCVTGLATVLIIAVAFGAGRLLDNYFDAGGIFTVLFLVGSFPVTLFVIMRLSLAAVSRSQRMMAARDEEEKEEEKAK